MANPLIALPRTDDPPGFRPSTDVVSAPMTDPTLPARAPAAGNQSRRHLGLVAAFGASRAWLLFAGLRPDLLGMPSDHGDVHRYAFYARRIVAGAWPYRDVRIEYPPGVLPFFLAPHFLGRAIGYVAAFELTMVVVDVIAFVAIVRLARRYGSSWAPTAWIVLPVFLGPIVYQRIDLVPAALTIWALERADRQHWGTAGFLLGVGVVAKGYPVLLLPAFLAFAVNRRRTILGFAAAIVAGLLPFVGSLGSLWTSVLAYHADRGIQLESVWSTVTLLGHSLTGYPVHIVGEYGALDMVSSTSPLLKSMATVLSLALFGTQAGLMWFAGRRLGPRRLPLACLSVLAILVGTGSVFSPQYVLWLIALATVALATEPRWRRAILGSMAVIAALTQVEYPWLYYALIHPRSNLVVVVVVRNALTIGLGAALLWRMIGLLRDAPYVAATAPR